MATITNKCGTVLYGWSGGLGCVLVSEEIVPYGTVRYLFGVLMYADSVSPGGSWGNSNKAHTSWLPVESINAAWILAFREKFINAR